jgi:hemerythrin
MGIEWQDDMATGIEGIDNQHREIFARFALFSDACSDGSGADELLRLLDFLAEYTAQHFLEEQEAMADADYPLLGAQEKAHQTFKDDFCRLRELVGKEGPGLETTLNEKRTMIRWLINHICHMDKAFADFLTANRTAPNETP